MHKYVKTSLRHSIDASQSEDESGAGSSALQGAGGQRQDQSSALLQPSESQHAPVCRLRLHLQRISRHQARLQIPCAKAKTLEQFCTVQDAYARRCRGARSRPQERHRRPPSGDASTTPSTWCDGPLPSTESSVHNVRQVEE